MTITFSRQNDAGSVNLVLVVVFVFESQGLWWKLEYDLSWERDW